MNWSQYQQDIFRATAETEDSLLIEAVAGSGKTSTIVEAINYVPAGQTVCFVAFNKSIAEELQRRVKRPGAQCMTLHSAGWAAWRRSLEWDSNLCKVDQGKTFGIMKEVLSWKDSQKWGETTRKLVALGKQRGIVPGPLNVIRSNGYIYNGLVEDLDSEWEDLCDHYSIDFDEVNLDLVRKVLARGIEIARESCDFDDMLYMPVVAGVAFDRWDVVFVDESQDVSGIQMEMISRMAKGRVVAVGDRNQAIYGFRGAHSGAMDELKHRFGMRELPLSISYRCPQAVVEKAKQWVPQIESAEGAEWGFVGEEGTDWRGQAQAALGASHFEASMPDRAIQEWPEGISKWQGIKDFQPGDAILCRLTRPIVALAFGLLRARIPCKVLGRDIGQGLTSLIKRVCKHGRLDTLAGLPAFAEALDEYLDHQRAKLTAKGKNAELGRLEDQAATVRIFMDEEERDGRDLRNADAGGLVGAEDETVAGLIADVERMFVDNGRDRLGVVLSTIHKSKGLEWERVFVLDAGELMPWKWAKMDWEFQQERNLMYVAATRSKRELRYVTSYELLQRGATFAEDATFAE